MPAGVPKAGSLPPTGGGKQSSASDRPERVGGAGEGCVVVVRAAIAIWTFVHVNAQKALEQSVCVRDRWILVLGCRMPGSGIDGRLSSCVGERDDCGGSQGVNCGF